jgi:hypothetical protein
MAKKNQRVLDGRFHCLLKLTVKLTVKRGIVVPRCRSVFSPPHCSSGAVGVDAGARLILIGGGDNGEGVVARQKGR